MGILSVICVFVIAVLLLVFWCVQLFRLMRMRDDDFVSREDKVIWFVLMMVLGVFGALLFWIYYRPVPERTPALELPFYEELKATFPDYADEIGLAVKMSALHRYDLERWYRSQTSNQLNSRFKQGPVKDVESGCFGVLLAVISVRNIDVG